jgi:hypothetical protein
MGFKRFILVVRSQSDRFLELSLQRDKLNLKPPEFYSKYSSNLKDIKKTKGRVSKLELKFPIKFFLSNFRFCKCIESQI